MADEKLSGSSPPSLSSPCLQNGSIRRPIPKTSPTTHQNGSLNPGLGHHSPTIIIPVPTQDSATSGKTPASTSTLWNLKTLVSSEGSSCSSRPWGQSLGSDVSSRTRTTVSRIKGRNSQYEEPEALLDLILESQGQRLNDQRASLSLLPNPGPAALCGACSPDQPSLPSLDFYYMLLHYQSDRMEDQRCSLPDLEDVMGSVPEGQEDFFSLIQRVQSRRMNEQRATLLTPHTEDEDEDDDAPATSPNHPHHHYW